MNGTGTHLVFNDESATRALPLAGGAPITLSSGWPVELLVGVSGALTEPACPMWCSPIKHLDLVTDQATSIGGDVPFYFVRQKRILFADIAPQQNIFVIAVTLP